MMHAMHAHVRKPMSNASYAYRHVLLEEVYMAMLYPLSWGALCEGTRILHSNVDLQ
jgi:hypothetical protein